MAKKTPKTESSVFVQARELVWYNNEEEVKTSIRVVRYSDGSGVSIEYPGCDGVGVPFESIKDLIEILSDFAHEMHLDA